MANNEFSQNFTNFFDKCMTYYDKYMVIGDLNYDLLCENKGKTLSELMELFDLTNLVKEATCLMKNCIEPLLDVILTNNKKVCMKTLNFATGVSDCHNMIKFSTIINYITPRNEKQKIKYRSFTNLDVVALNEDLSKVNVPISNVNSQVDTDMKHEKFESNITDIFDKHVPVKEKYCRKNQLPYMNRELRKSIYKKKMFYPKFLKNKNAKT